jgi:hypothetical protein
LSAPHPRPDRLVPIGEIQPKFAVISKDDLVLRAMVQLQLLKRYLAWKLIDHQRVRCNRHDLDPLVCFFLQGSAHVFPYPRISSDLRNAFLIGNDTADKEPRLILLK